MEPNAILDFNGKNVVKLACGTLKIKLLPPCIPRFSEKLESWLERLNMPMLSNTNKINHLHPETTRTKLNYIIVTRAWVGKLFRHLDLCPSSGRTQSQPPHKCVVSWSQCMAAEHFDIGQHVYTLFTSSYDYQ